MDAPIVPLTLGRPPFARRVICSMDALVRSHGRSAKLFVDVQQHLPGFGRDHPFAQPARDFVANADVGREVRRHRGLLAYKVDDARPLRDERRQGTTRTSHGLLRREWSLGTEGPTWCGCRRASDLQFILANAPHDRRLQNHREPGEDYYPSGSHGWQNLFVLRAMATSERLGRSRRLTLGARYAGQRNPRYRAEQPYVSTNQAPTGRIVLAGGTGFLGLSLARFLSGPDCEVVLLSRSAPPAGSPWKHASWDMQNVGEWAKHLDGATALVNIAGRTVDCIKTPEHVDEILRSRVESTELLGRALEGVRTPPSVWVQMSTAHRYGDSRERVCDEDSPFGYGLAPFVAQAWEEAHAKALLPGMRSVVLRTSFVLGRSAGALPRLAKLARIGLGGTVGSGTQGISWIHAMDLNRLFSRAITDRSMAGAYLATAPTPVSNAEFMRALRRILKVPVGLPAATWMVRIGAPLFLRTDPDLALYGRYCVSKRLREEGFEFSFPEIKRALDDLYGG